MVTRNDGVADAPETLPSSAPIRSVWARYTVALLCTITAVVWRYALDNVFGNEAPVAMFFLAVFISAYYGGLGPGLLATFLGAFLSRYLFVQPRHAILPVGLASGTLILTYVLVSIVMSLLWQAFQRARYRERLVVWKWRHTSDELAETLLMMDRANVLLRDMDDHITRWNSGCRELYGYTAAQALHQTSHDLLKTQFPVPPADIRRRLLSTGSWTGELVHTTAAGHQITVLSHWYLYRDSLHHPRAIIEVNTDITAQKIAERQRLESEEQLRATFDQVAVGIAHVSLEGRWLRFNDKLCEITGYSREQLAIKTFQEITYPDDLQADLDNMRQLVAGRIDHYTIEKRYLRGDGLLVWVDLTVSLLRDSDGKPKHFISVIEDISRRKEAEIARTRMAALVEYSWDAIVGENLDGTITSWNSGATRLFGYTADEAMGRHISIIGDPEIPDDIPQIINRVRRGEFVRRVEAHRVRKDGQRILVSLSVSPIRDAHNNIVGIAKIAHDITELKQRQLDQQRSEQRFRSLIEATAAIVWNISSAGQFEPPQPQWSQYTGQTPEQYRGWGWLDAIHPDDREQTTTRWREAMSRGTLYHNQHRVRRYDGEYRSMLVRAVPIRDDDGSIREWVGAHTDIEELKRAQRKAEEANKAKDQFLAVLSHELRTPLTPMLAVASELENDPRVPKFLLDDVRMIRRNTELEKRLIDDLLDLTRIAKGKLDLERRPVDLTTAVAEAIRVCSVEADAKGVLLQQEVRDSLFVEGDPSRLQQVFWNLINNAIKFTPPGGVITVCSCAPTGSEVCFQVHDTGMGIEPDALERIFNAFEQLEQGSGRQFGGLGLGLAICKAIVAMHHGTIQAFSEGKGKGANFTVRLPRLVGPQTEHLRPATRPSQQPLRKLRILLVEDHPDTARILGQLLRRQGHEVTIAHNVKTALKLGEQGTYDVLVSDLGLPDGSGLDVMRELRERRNLKGVALSGYGMDDDIRRSHEAGFAEHLTKPVNFGRLTEVLRNIATDEG